MNFKEYIKDKNKRKEGICYHLNELNEILREMIEEIECIESYLRPEDDDYYD